MKVFIYATKARQLKFLCDHSTLMRVLQRQLKITLIKVFKWQPHDTLIKVFKWQPHVGRQICNRSPQLANGFVLKQQSTIYSYTVILY